MRVHLVAWAIIATGCGEGTTPSATPADERSGRTPTATDRVLSAPSTESSQEVAPGKTPEETIENIRKALLTGNFVALYMMVTEDEQSWIENTVRGLKRESWSNAPKSEVDEFRGSQSIPESFKFFLKLSPRDQDRFEKYRFFKVIEIVRESEKISQIVKTQEHYGVSVYNADDIVALRYTVDGREKETLLIKRHGRWYFSVLRALDW